MILNINILYIVLIFLFIRCNPRPKATISAPEGIPKDSIQLSSDSLKTSPAQIKEFNLQYENLIQKSLLHKLPVLNESGLKHWNIAGIDAFMEPEFKYHVLDTLALSPDSLLILIGREYVNENIVWLCSYSLPLKLEKSIELYYDNAEGNYQLESRYSNGVFELSSDDVNEGKKTAFFTLDELWKTMPTED